MNFGKMGLVVFVLGLAIAAGAGMNRMSLDRRATNASVAATLADNAWRRINHRADGEDLREARDKMIPWIIGGGIAAVLGLGMIFAAGGSFLPTRTCPKCAETVRAAAVVCKHCGTDLQPVAPNQSKSSYRALAKAAEDAERKVKRS
ncbi:zinc ribbon domain-containing protein [Pseudoxanthomonas sp.]|uniref:zinc ribbon domain-containing protein n=1 Tax=Pseudoxanthomonas sp. TaxID=1871049 RepID=UPI0025E3842F|nr:zinc ribbon domain-containing protein [Pseudoxanthomonas sp.]